MRCIFNNYCLLFLYRDTDNNCMLLLHTELQITIVCYYIYTEVPITVLAMLCIADYKYLKCYV